MKKLTGITTAMVTPFAADGAVDLAAIAQLTDFLVTKGVHCLYPLGTTGEMLRLSEQERKQVAETVIKQNDRRATVYIHVGAMTQRETLALAQHAWHSGADGIGVVTPAFFGATDEELAHYFINVAQSVPEDFPVYLYNIPQCAANNLSAEVAQRVADRCPNVVGIKYSYPDYLTVNHYLTLNQETFSVVVGADRLFLPALAMGCDGVVSGVSCVYPEPFIAVWKAWQDGDIDAARRAQRRANRFCETLRNGSNMAFFKAGLAHRGIAAGSMRAPQRDLSPEAAADLINQLTILEQEAGLV
ncbi:Dihydrodipicolinate synthase [Paramixta manurensis]|uniref:Dihydrodipicolinate synthase n=1 Tax=Paramixta manurensis TaxID=2740817 RepID=A0A6M8UBQ8_9GAMM|nr:Dihydrodipicolinate synthase [Erwiniaceae bacterium PD-1]